METKKIIEESQILFYLISISLISISAQISIEVPFFNTQIPITAQSMAVLIVGFSSTKNQGWLAVFFYLVLGAVGFPIFADGSAGLEKLYGYSGGYLIGFVFAAYFMVYLRKQSWHKKTQTIILSMLLGTLCILIPGYLQLSYFIGLQDALFKGIIPFLPGALIKIILGAVPFIFINNFK